MTSSKTFEQPGYEHNDWCSEDEYDEAEDTYDVPSTLYNHSDIEARMAMSTAVSRCILGGKIEAAAGVPILTKSTWGNRPPVERLVLPLHLQFLADLRLSHLVERFTQLGVESVDDFKMVERVDLSGLDSETKTLVMSAVNSLKRS